MDKAQFRKKPVVIDAIQWTGDNAEGVQTFLHDGNTHAAKGWVKGRYVEIGTLEGVMVASPGDWIIKGVQGEFYPCKPDIFVATYEPADQPPSASGEREAFEAWVSASGRAHQLAKDKTHGWYTDLTVTAWWTAWQARAALAPSPGIDAAGQDALRWAAAALAAVAADERDRITMNCVTHSIAEILDAANAALEPSNNAAAKKIDAAAEIWAAAQLAPGEGMQDGIERIGALLSAQPSAEQQPVAWLQQNIDRPTWFEIAGAKDKAVTKDWTDASPVFRQPADAQPSVDDPQFPFYELRFIMRVLNRQGSAPKEDWQTAYGMARDIFVRWSKERQAAPPSAAWLAEMERLVDEHAAAIATAAKYCGTPYQTAKHAARAALLAHLRTKP